MWKIESCGVAQILGLKFLLMLYLMLHITLFMKEMSSVTNTSFSNLLHLSMLKTNSAGRLAGEQYNAMIFCMCEGIPSSEIWCMYAATENDIFVIMWASWKDCSSLIPSQIHIWWYESWFTPHCCYWGKIRLKMCFLIKDLWRHVSKPRKSCQKFQFSSLSSVAWQSSLLDLCLLNNSHPFWSVLGFPSRVFISYYFEICLDIIQPS